MCKKPSTPPSPKYHRRGFFSPVWRSLGWHGVPVQKSARSRPGPQSESPELITYDELPEWAKDNHFITTGYRRIRPCDVHCVDSLFYLHNETVNIWSHGLPFLCGILLSFKTLLVDLPSLGANATDALAFLPLILGSLVCYGCSAVFHMFLCHSEKKFLLWSKLDYVGIVLILWGGFFSMVWYLFYDSLRTKLAFIAVNTLCCASACFVILQDRFAAPDMRSFRVLPFALLFCTSAAPTYLAFNRPTSEPEAISDVLGYYRACFLTLAVGAAIFALRIPERFVPRVFDCIGHSHSLFHILVVVAVHYYHQAVVHAFLNRAEF